MILSDRDDERFLVIESTEYPFTYLLELLSKAKIRHQKKEESLFIGVAELDKLMDSIKKNAENYTLPRLILCDLLIAKMQLNGDINSDEMLEKYDKEIDAVLDTLSDSDDLTKDKKGYSPIAPLTGNLAECFSSLISQIKQQPQKNVAPPYPKREAPKDKDIKRVSTIRKSLAIMCNIKAKSDSDYIAELKDILLKIQSSRVPVESGIIVERIMGLLYKINDLNIISNFVEELLNNDEYKVIRERKGFITLSFHGHSDGTKDVSKTFTYILRAVKYRMARIAIANDELRSKLTDEKTKEGKFINAKLSHPNLFFSKSSKTMDILKDRINGEKLLAEEEKKFRDMLISLRKD